MITPEILPTDSPGVTNQLPRTPDTFMSPVSEKQAKPPLPPAFTPARRGQADATTTPAVSQSAGRTLDASEQAALAAAQRIDAQRSAQEQANATQAAPAQAVAPRVVEPQQVAPVAAKPAAGDTPTFPTKSAEKSWKQQQKDEAKRLEIERKQSEKLAKEQAKRDAQAAKDKAKADKIAAEEEKKKEAEEKKQAKRQAALLEERQQEIDAASERLRASEAAYQAELAKRSSR